MVGSFESTWVGRKQDPNNVPLTAAVNPQNLPASVPCSLVTTDRKTQTGSRLRGVSFTTPAETNPVPA